MTLPRNLSAYAECEEFFSQAMDSPAGIKINLETHGKAVRLRQKLNAYRVKLREQSRKIRTEDDPGYDVSPYDDYVVSLSPGATFLTIKRNVVKVVSIETLEPENEG